MLSRLVPRVGYRATLAIAGYLISNVAFVYAALYLYKLTLYVVEDERQAWRATALFCFNPASVFYSSMYPLRWLILRHSLVVVRSFGSSSKPNIPCMISCIMLFVMTPVTPICLSLRNFMLGWLLISFSCAPVLYSPPLSQMRFFDGMLPYSVQLGKEVYVASHALWLVCFVWIFKQQICRMSFTDAVVFIPHALLLEPCELYWENTFQYNNTLFFRCLP